MRNQPMERDRAHRETLCPIGKARQKWKSEREKRLSQQSLETHTSTDREGGLLATGK